MILVNPYHSHSLSGQGAVSTGDLQSISLKQIYVCLEYSETCLDVDQTVKTINYPNLSFPKDNCDVGNIL